MQSVTCSLQSVVCGLRSAVCSLQSAVCSLQSGSLQSANVRHRSCVRRYRTHFASLKRVEDLRVYQGFMMPFNHQAGHKVL